MAKARILVVEDDEAIRIAVEEKLTIEGYAVVSAGDGEEARDRLADEPPDLVLLDLMLPKLDGIEVLKWLRRLWPELPVLILSAKGQEEEKVAGLRAGADDYLAKPFGIKELMARIEALLRRSRGSEAPVTFGDITVDFHGKKVLRRGKEVLLSRTELQILMFLVRHRDRTVSREEIMDAVWGYDVASTERAVDYHVLHLRRKLEHDPSTPAHILTRHGLGYQLKC
jgi:two-component system alkaline phosphatase synthesis response regulator PhoP